MIAAHPEQAKEIIESLDRNEEQEALAMRPLTEEELDLAVENHVPLSFEETSETITMLRTLGLVIE